jgi:hypothetical protein
MTVIALPTVAAEPAPAVMRDLAPARPTGSSVEVIPPRRPRPVSTPASGSVRTEADATRPAASEIPPESGQHGEEGFSSGAATKMQGSRGSGTVETGIGPLPADLWQMLGQQARGEAQASASSV